MTHKDIIEHFIKVDFRAYLKENHRNCYSVESNVELALDVIDGRVLRVNEFFNEKDYAYFPELDTYLSNHKKEKEEKQNGYMPSCRLSKIG